MIDVHGQQDTINETTIKAFFMTSESNILDFQVPNEQFVDHLSRLVGRALNSAGWVLSCEDIELTTDEVCAKDGLLPLVMWISGQTLEKVWGKPQELVFRCDANALCGVVPDLKRPLLPSSVWLHAIHFELENAIQRSPDGPALIDDWFARWNAALTEKKILLLPPKAAPSPAATN